MANLANLFPTMEDQGQKPNKKMGRPILSNEIRPIVKKP